MIVARPGILGVIGWIDRYWSMGILNVLTPSRCARRQSATLQSGRARTTSTAWPSASCCSFVWPSYAVTLPLLSIITWSPFVGALLIMFTARRTPAPYG